MPYDKIIKPAEGIEVRFVDAGHLLGSSSIEVWMTEEDKTEKIVFSGDIGNINQPLIRDPVYIREADYIVMESTYGDRSMENVRIIRQYWQRSSRGPLTEAAVW